ncbi:MAG: hypothetical protein KME23_21160 [Goleter apudmare HA4340-LM2]|jgi:hypothetical protein|nr:hypothetical protein [Goleter apudmare HA4340-LM2]
MVMLREGDRSITLLWEDRQLAEGDLVLLQDKDQLLGIARIKVIKTIILSV